MADCARVHEQSHVDFGNASCAKLVAVYKAEMDAIAKAEKSKSEADLKDAEQKGAALEKAVDEYTKWFNTTCRENERRAYQAGIDACKKDDVRKSCADLRETAGYNKNMKDWETFRDNPPNCPAPPEESKKTGPEKKAPEKKEEKQPKLTEPAKLSVSMLSEAPQRTLPASMYACAGHSQSGGECAESRETKLQCRAAGSGRETAPSIVHEVLGSHGQPLDAATRAFFDQRFNHDFGRVRIHADANAGQSVRAVNALAYTVGQDIVFAAGHYRPHTTAGRELLAHELVHTIQQSGAVAGHVPGTLSVGDPGDAAEREAESAAKAALAGDQTAAVSNRAAPPAIQRQDSEPGISPTPQDAPPQPGPSAPGDVIQAGGTGTGGSGTAPGGPTCQPTGLDRAAFLATAGATTEDFGLTTLDVSAVTYPDVNTNPAKPKGVTVAATSAALPTIPSVFTKAGIFVEGDATVVGGDERSCPSGKYPVRWIIAPQGAQKISDGEQEHCSDFQFAFDISLKQYAASVNGLASSGRVFPDDKAVDTALTRATGVAPANWQTVFVCLARKSLLRDPRSKGGPSWHTPRPTRLTPTFPDCKDVRVIISDASLPEVGKHPSSEIIKGCGEKQVPSARQGAQ
ncbi:MAG TPA: DUF4157 domain-containing protein [Silvibacterium sp.]|nr:DUF4157 domain-containing protein [Silvibacterium sp.]